MLNPLSIPKETKNGPDHEDSREKTLDRINQYKKAQTKLELKCKELGIEVPTMACNSNFK